MSKIAEVHRVLHVLPHPGGGGEEYVRLIGRMSDFQFERRYLSASRSPLGAVAALPSIVREARRYSIVQVHGDAASLVCLPALRRWPAIITTHGLSLLRRSSGVRGAWITRAMRVAVARSAATICNSTAERDELAAVLGDTSKLHLIPNGVEIPEVQISAEERDAERRALGLNPSDVAVIWVGSLEPAKDPLTFARAVALAGPPVVGLIAGSGSMRPALEARAHDRLRVLGHRDDLDLLLPACDAFAMTSQREGLSLAILEAMASGLPTIASDRPANPEVLGEAGILFPFGDAPALAERLRRLAASHELRRALGVRGRKRVQECYDARRMVEDTRALYGVVLAH